MSEYFWEGFDKRAGVQDWVQKGKKFLGGLPGKFPGVTGMAQQVPGYAASLKNEAIKGLHEGLQAHAKKVGGKTSDLIYQNLEHIAKNISDPTAMTEALQNLGERFGAVKRPKSLLERAGSFVKKHPYSTAAGGAVGLGGLAYGLGRREKPQPQPMQSMQDFQYYNPYY